jgi:hypothetical protein
MKTIRINIDKWFDKQDKNWRALPLKRQRRYTLYFFAGYLLLTVVVIFKVWYDTGKPNSSMAIEHIENPVLKKEKAAALQDNINNPKK